MKSDIIQLIAAFFGAGGFALVFNVRPSLVIYGALGGLLSWGLFLLMEDLIGNHFVACLVSSAFSAFYAEVMARIKKTPASVFFIPSLIPHVPGSSLFYCMSAALESDWNAFRSYGTDTLQYALGIACGISFTWAIWYMVQKYISDRVKKIGTEP